MAKYGKNVMLAYGGGSVADYAKAVSVSAYCEEDPWEKYYVVLFLDIVPATEEFVTAVEENPVLEKPKKYIKLSGGNQDESN